MNKKEFGKWMRDRHLGRDALYFELVYAVILLLTLIYAFPVFMHLIALQGILISLYLFIGWVYDAYARSHNQQLIKVNKRDTLWQTITSIQINRRFFFRLFEALVVLTTLCSAILMIQPIFTYLMQAPNPHVSENIQNLNLYCNFIAVIDQIVVLTAILGGKRRMLFFASLLALVLFFILFFSQRQLLISELVGFMTALAALFIAKQKREL